MFEFLLTDVMKQVIPPRPELYTRGELENKEGVTLTIYFGVDFHARQREVGVFG